MKNIKSRYAGALRWLRTRSESPAPSPTPTPEPLSTSSEVMLFNQFDNTTTVLAQCFHLKSQFGLFDSQPAWIPYLQLEFPSKHKLQQAEFIVEVRPHSNTDKDRLERPAMSKLVFYPKFIRGGARMNAEKERGYEVNPTVNAGGAEVSIGNTTAKTTRNFENAIDKSTLWEVHGATQAIPLEMARCPRQAKWLLQGKGDDASLPRDLKTGFIVMHKASSRLLLTARIEGTMQGRLFGEYKLGETSDAFDVEIPGEGDSSGDREFKPVDYSNWTKERMKDDMVAKNCGPDWSEVEMVEEAPVL